MRITGTGWITSAGVERNGTTLGQYYLRGRESTTGIVRLCCSGMVGELAAEHGEGQQGEWGTWGSLTGRGQRPICGGERRR